jgi:hypothetical protein
MAMTVQESWDALRKRQADLDRKAAWLREERERALGEQSLLRGQLDALERTPEGRALLKRDVEAMSEATQQALAEKHKPAMTKYVIEVLRDGHHCAVHCRWNDGGWCLLFEKDLLQQEGGPTPMAGRDRVCPECRDLDGYVDKEELTNG